MAEKKSSFINMVATLLIITAFAGIALAYVNQLTIEPKKQAQMQKKLQALEAVLPNFNNNPAEEMYKIISVNGIDSLEVYPASLNGNPIGIAVTSVSHKGFGGDVRVIVGLDTNQVIKAIKVIDHKETPGFGTKMDNESFKSQLYNSDPMLGEVLVTADGGSVDAITGATVSSRAFCDAIENACNSYSESFDTSLGSIKLEDN